MKFYQDQNEGRHKLIPTKLSKNESERVIDLKIYKNQYVVIKKLHMSLGNHNCNYVCTRCLIFYTSQKILTEHKQQCGEQERYKYIKIK